MNTIEIFKALSNEYRLQILSLLKNPSQQFSAYESAIDMDEVGVCVCKIQKKLGLTQSTTSHYLTILQKADLLTATRIGKWTYYRRNEVTIKRLRDFIDQEL